MYADQDQNLAVMSIGFLLKNKNDAVVWRGPKKHGIFTSSFFCHMKIINVYLPVLGFDLML